MDKKFTPVPGYQTLGGILLEAYNQAARTKGAERHANGLPFDKQPMQAVADQRGIGFLLGQADKKSIEAQRMLERGEVSKARHELLGAINYIAGAILFVDRTQTPKQDVGITEGEATAAAEPVKFDPEAELKKATSWMAVGNMDTPAPTFKVGDRVRITNDSEAARVKCIASRAGWNPLMHLQCGALGTVIEASKYNTFRVKTLSGDSCWWPAGCLEYAPAEQEPESERRGTAVHMIVLDDSDPDVASIQRMLEGFLRGQ